MTADTGLWLALANRRDAWHDRAVRVLDDLDEPLVTTWPVLTETCHLLVSRMGVQSELAFVASIRDGACGVAELGAGDWPRIATLMERYRALPMDLADASLVILAEHLGDGRILSTDRRKEREPFHNLLA